ncbi:MAG: hypothetical protein AAF411_31935 [Myxococcota bacterium]
MSKLSDLARSFLRSGLDQARERSRVPDRLRRLVREATSQGTQISEADLGAALSQTDGVSALSVTARRGELQLHGSFETREPLGGRIAVDAIRFAPRGAKELVFKWQPEENARHPMVRPLVGTLAGVVAHHLWSVVLGPAGGDMSGAIVDRDGPSLFRVDLRSVPAVREAIRKGAPGLIIDALALGDLTMEDGSLRLRFRLPGLFG